MRMSFIAFAAVVVLSTLSFGQAVFIPAHYTLFTYGAPPVAPTGTDGLYGNTLANLCTGTSPNGSGGVATFCPDAVNLAPYIDGIQFPLRWPIGYNSDGGVDTGIESLTIPTQNPPAPSQYNFTNLDKTVLNIWTNLDCGAKIHAASHKCWFAIQLGPSQAANANIAQTPDYVYQFGAAKWPDMACTAWTSGQVYWRGQCAQFGGQYYQSTDSTSHTATGTVGPTSDGGSWAAPAAHAPPLDVACNTTQSYTANTIPGSSGNSNSCASGAISNINTTNCGTGTQACTTAMLEVGTEAFWETPLLIAQENAMNAFNNFVKAKAYVTNYKYNRNGIFTDGTSFNNAETSLQLLAASQANIELIVVGAYQQLLDATAAAIRSTGALVDCNFAGNTTTEDTNLTTMCAGHSDMIGVLGLQMSDIGNYWKGSRVTNGWTDAFKNNVASMKAFHLQNLAHSDTTQCGTSITTTGSQSCVTFMLPFAAEIAGNRPIYYEAYPPDLRCAFTTINAPGCNGTDPNADWANAFLTFSQGFPLPLGLGVGR